MSIGEASITGSAWGHVEKPGFRRTTALLQAAGGQVGEDRGQRIWRREGLEVPEETKPTRKLWFSFL
jgi:hypothetical protein